MQQRDIIKDQIEYFGAVIGKAINLFLGYKGKGEILQGIVATNKALLSALDLNIDELINLSSAELQNFFNARMFAPEQIEQLGEYISEIGAFYQESENDLALLYYRCAMELYQLAGWESQVFSMDREDTISALKIIIQSLEAN